MRYPTISNAFAAAALMSGLVAGQAMAQTGPSAAALAGGCAGCHGNTGSSVGPSTPTIANLTVEYFTQSMLAYKSGQRKSTIMTRIAKGYTDDEIKAMAKYFDSQKFVRGPQTFDQAKVAAGRDLHRKYCDSCHEGDGKKSDGIGVLAGQWGTYLSYSIADFMSGARPMETRKRQKMEQLKNEHGDAGFAAVVQFYSSVRD